MEKKEFKQIVRVVGADLEGNKPVYNALRKIKGIDFMFANAVCAVANLDKGKLVGELSEEEINKVSSIIKNPEKYGIISWLLNRRKDFNSGQDNHLVDADLGLRKEFDIKRLRKIKCYRGVRHSLGLPVRGQRTRSNFRHGKTVGVRKKGLKVAAEKEKKGGKREEKK